MIVANVREDSPKVEEFVRSGGGAIVFLGDHYTEKYNPAYLPAEIEAEFDSPQKVSWLTGEHPSGLTGELRLGEFDLQKIEVNRGYVLEPKEGAKVVASLSSGWPLFVTGGYGSGTVSVFASSADRDWNNFAAKPFYSPFLRALARHNAGTPFSEGSASLKVGEAIRQRAVPGCEMKVPSGKMLGLRTMSDEIVFTDTEDTGFYRLYAGSKELKTFVVNLDTDSGESDLTPASAAELRKYFSGSVLRSISAEGWEGKFMAALSGREITKYIMFLAQKSIEFSLKEIFRFI